MVTSYAQNFEDVILHRALKHVSRGFYIDVGAWHPTSDSVSLAFHQLGWTGIHVEPLPQLAEALRQNRPGDVVIEAAISEFGGPVTLYEADAGRGISTCDPGLAQRNREAGYSVREVVVPSTRLSEILERYCPAECHWMKIDVEGFEANVIRSWTGSDIRPWVVVVESTEPMRPTPNHTGWEPSLLALGYKFVYFDGLNRFYVSELHPELEQSFSCGPNYFDDFTITPQHWLAPRHVAAPPPPPTLRGVIRARMPNWGLRLYRWLRWSHTTAPLRGAAKRLLRRNRPSGRIQDQSAIEGQGRMASALGASPSELSHAHRSLRAALRART